MKALAIKSREFSRARFALRKVHLANIDRNNLRFTSLHFSCTRRIPVVNGETDETGNKIKFSLERTRVANAGRMYVCGRSRKSRPRASALGVERFR